MSNTLANAVVSFRHEVAPGLLVLRVAPTGWELPAFEPGQFAVLGLPSTAPRCAGADPDEAEHKPGLLIRRAYSIASPAAGRNELELFINLVPSGEMTPRLFALAEGAKLWLGPRISGLFTLDRAPATADLILVATGTGLAPYMSMLRSTLLADPSRRVAVLLGARRARELGYRRELEAMQREHPHVLFEAIISRLSEELEPWLGPVGRVQDLWRSGAVARAWGRTPDPSRTHVFLCGNPGMVDEMCGLLAGEGFTEHRRDRPGQVHVERFW